MNKKLLAVAVASVLAAPATALAQVTINGIFKVGIDQYKINNPAAARAGLNTSEMRITDNSSRIIIGVTEDLGGGLAAIGQWDIRGGMDTGGTGQTAVAGTTASSVAAISNSGNTWIGLRSNSMGSLTLGRHDLHYGKQPDDIAAKAGALMAASVSLMDYAGGGGTAIAVASRTANVVRWDSPNWGGFTVTAAYSTQVGAQEADLSGSGSKGSAINLNPAFTASNWQLGASLWNSKADGGLGTAGTGTEQDGMVIYGYWRIGGWKIGAASNSSSITNGLGVDTSDRTAFTIPVSFTTGAHNFYAHYTTADDDDKIAGDNGAKMMAFAYVYDLSKRTSVGVTYAKLTNEAAATYNFFTNSAGAGTTSGGLASVGSALTAGEDGALIAFTIRHAF
jgi:predicted porin